MKNIIICLLQNIKKNQQGHILVTVSFALITLVGITAFVIDIGGLYVEKSKLQKTLDAAVLAGASQLSVSQAKAVDKAKEIVNKNNYINSDSDKIDTGADFIKITKTVEKAHTVASLIGGNSSNITASAKAQVKGVLLGRDGIVPVGIPSDKLPKEGETGYPFPDFPMIFEPGNSGGGKNPSNEGNYSVKGNFGFLAINGPGGNLLRENIRDGADLEVSEEMYEWTQTGLSWGNVSKGFQDRIDADISKSYCSVYETADSSCSRVIIVPIVDSYTDATGKTLMKITGFASLWISSIDGKGNEKMVNAKYIDTITFGEFGDPGDAKNYYVNGVTLVE